MKEMGGEDHLKRGGSIPPFTLKGSSEENAGIGKKKRKKNTTPVFRKERRIEGEGKKEKGGNSTPAEISAKNGKGRKGWAFLCHLIKKGGSSSPKPNDQKT